MKTQILSTPQGVIVKIDSDLIQFDSAFKRAEKKCEGVGRLRFKGYRGGFTIYTAFNAVAKKWKAPFSDARHHCFESARCAQSRAARLLAVRGGCDFILTSHSGSGWVERLIASGRVHRIAARYAFDPQAYTAAFPTPKLP